MDPINWHSFFFLLFALVTCAFAVGVVISSNIVRMAFFLIVSLGASAGLFFLAGAAFLGAIQLLIYVGGTLVLLIFGVMLTAQGPFISMKTRGGEWVLAAIVGGSLLVVLLQAAFSVPDWQRTRARGVTDNDDLYARVVFQARQPGREYEGVRVRFEPLATVETSLADEPQENAAGKHAGETGRVVYDEADRTLTVAIQPGETTAADIVLAMSDAAAADRFLARLPKGSTGGGRVAADDDATLSLSPPKTDVAAGELGLALLGARPDEPGDPETGRRGASGYLLPFEIISVHLVVVLIGAAYLARTKRRVKPTQE